MDKNCHCNDLDKEIRRIQELMLKPYTKDEILDKNMFSKEALKACGISEVNIKERKQGDS